MVKATLQKASGELLGIIYLTEKTFKTGSKGLHGFGKLEDGNGKRY